MINVAEEVAGKRFTKHSDWLQQLDLIAQKATDKEVKARAESLAKALIVIINIRQAPSNKMDEYTKAKRRVASAIVAFLEQHNQ